jgi:hypothetical protein
VQIRTPELAYRAQNDDQLSQILEHRLQTATKRLLSQGPKFHFLISQGMSLFAAKRKARVIKVSDDDDAGDQPTSSSDSGNIESGMYPKWPIS